ncbi:hypothetical protein GGX14DRAFT_181592 [Mycena pura]|uniref:Uncharacterized protein n=1 Tax=Mycena pura TaxID=153505 RepID=A0AAD6UYV2_9AGAR|nr:hypothetical protein GGX14DRAFT_181592 [Mycena pura]
MSRLPSSFTSLYRLFLRTCAASVLQHTRTTKTLRKFWRPTFADAAHVTTRLQSSALSPAERNDLENWLHDWHLRIDNTLALLYTSSKSRGLAHRLTRNLGLLIHGEQTRINGKKLHAWKPSRVPDAPEYQTEFLEHQLRKRQDAEAPLNKIIAWNGLEEVLRMAEGRSEISLSKVWRIKRTRYP